MSYVSETSGNEGKEERSIHILQRFWESYLEVIHFLELNK